MGAAASLQPPVAICGDAVQPNSAVQKDIHHFACRYGAFAVQLNWKAAPQTSAYFSRIFSSPEFARANIFRIVTEANSSLRTSVPIEVVQFGLDHDGSSPFDQIMHESTEMTGLRHAKWTISAARYDEGQAYPSFFVCMRDEPELDHGGKRNEDGAGFAAFGKVISGFETLKRIFAQAEATDYLREPISIETDRNQ